MIKFRSYIVPNSYFLFWKKNQDNRNNTNNDNNDNNNEHNYYNNGYKQLLWWF